MKKKTIIGLVVLIAFTSLLFLNFGESVGGYMNFSEAEASGARAHVVGEWVQERRFDYDPASNTFSFHMRDDQGTVRRVVYNNPKPASFEDAESVVIEGISRGDTFEAEFILVKCPSKYNAEMTSNASG